MRDAGHESTERRQLFGLCELLPLTQHLLEQLNVLDAYRELPSQFVYLRQQTGFIRECRVFDDEGAERPAPAAQWRQQDRLVGFPEHLRMLQTQTASGGSLPVFRARSRRRRGVGKGGGGQRQGPGAAIVQPDGCPLGPQHAVRFLDERVEARSDAEGGGNRAGERPQQVSEWYVGHRAGAGGGILSR